MNIYSIYIREINNIDKKEIKKEIQRVIRQEIVKEINNILYQYRI